MKDYKTDKKGMYKKIASVTLATMLSASVIPTVNIGTALATTNSSVVNSEAEAKRSVIVAEQVGNRKAITEKELLFSVGSNLQPTGLAANPGNVVTVYVDSGGSSKLPKIVFSQQEGAWSSWKHEVQLKEGKNEIVVPEIWQDNKYEYSVPKGGTIYILNPYTEAEQNKAPVITIEGAYEIPYMTKNTDPAEFKAFLTEYVQKLNNGTATIDVVEMVSDHVIYTGTARSAYNKFVVQNNSPLDVVNGYDTWMHKAFEANGLDGKNAQNDPTLIREHIRVMQPWGFMYAAYDHTGIRKVSADNLLTNLGTTYAGWALNHELGHRLDTAPRCYGEVTNNMTSMLMGVEYGVIDNRIPFESMYSYLIREEQGKMASLSLAERLGAFWQIELAYPGYWAKLESLYRDRKITVKTDNEKQQYLIKLSSEVVNKDLSSHFARHGFTVNEETKEAVSKYDEPDKIWYLNNSVINYERDGFADNATVNANIMLNKDDKKNILYLSIDADAQDDLLGYEIYHNGKLVGFTATDKFIHTGIDPNADHTYQIIAYDKKLNPLESQDFVPVADPGVENIEKIVKALKYALTESDLSAINSIAINSSGTLTGGNEEEKKARALFNEALGDSVQATYNINLSNPGDVSVDEILTNNLFMMYQTKEDSAFYRYAKGNITNLKKEVVGIIDPSTWGVTEESALSQAEANINKIKNVLRSVLTSEEVDINQLTEVFIINPKLDGYEGTEMDMKVVELVEQSLEGNVTGTYSIHLQGATDVSVEELLENHLVITYQLEDGGEYYMYSNNSLEQL